MRDQRDDASAVQAAVTLVSGIGLAFVTIVLVIAVSRFTDRSAEQDLRSATVLVAIGWPFALGITTRWCPRDLRNMRRVWLLCCLGIPLTLIVLHRLCIPVAVSLVYPWAFWMTRGTAGQHRT